MISRKYAIEKHPMKRGHIQFIEYYQLIIHLQL